jgi:antirestriction protein ArdC
VRDFESEAPAHGRGQSATEPGIEAGAISGNHRQDRPLNRGGDRPWIQPWSGASPLHAGQRWHPARLIRHQYFAVVGGAVRAGYDRDRWLTSKQALAPGGGVRKCEHATTVARADRFTPKSKQDAATGEDDSLRFPRSGGARLRHLDQ